MPGRQPDTPIPAFKICVICETPFSRPAGMQVSTWRERKTCSKECANKNRSIKKRERLRPLRKRFFLGRTALDTVDDDIL